MHKDILVFLPEHEEKAKRIIDLFLEKKVKDGYYGIINICGISGTGKSEVAWFVARQLYKLGISNHIVNLDRMYKTCPSIRDDWRKRTGVIGHEEMDWLRIEKELMIFDNNDIKVLIIEGLYAGYVDGGLTFYLEGNIESSDEFRHLRGKEKEDDPWRQYVVAEEYADILRGAKNHDYTI